MHGAKGLEWDVVIVPGIGRQPRGDREPLLNWLELPGSSVGSSSELLLAPISAAGAGSKTKGAVAATASRNADVPRSTCIAVFNEPKEKPPRGGLSNPKNEAVRP